MWSSPAISYICAKIMVGAGERTPNFISKGKFHAHFLGALLTPMKFPHWSSCSLVADADTCYFVCFFTLSHRSASSPTPDLFPLWMPTARIAPPFPPISAFVIFSWPAPRQSSACCSILFLFTWSIIDIFIWLPWFWKPSPPTVIFSF